MTGFTQAQLYDYYAASVEAEHPGTFVSTPSYVNIIGVRGWINGQTTQNTHGEYNDTITLVWQESGPTKKVLEFVASVDPGKGLVGSSKGDAHLMPGQYIYKVGKKKGHEILLLKGTNSPPSSTVRAWRDKKMDRDVSSIYKILWTPNKEGQTSTVSTITSDGSGSNSTWTSVSDYNGVPTPSKVDGGTGYAPGEKVTLTDPGETGNSIVVEVVSITGGGVIDAFTYAPEMHDIFNVNGIHISPGKWDDKVTNKSYPNQLIKSNSGTKSPYEGTLWKDDFIGKINAMVNKADLTYTLIDGGAIIKPETYFGAAPHSLPVTDIETKMQVWLAASQTPQNPAFTNPAALAWPERETAISQLPLLKLTSRSTNVTILEKALHLNDITGFSRDRVFTTKTKSGIKRIQKSYGLSETGEVNKDTWRIIYWALANNGKPLYYKDDPRFASLAIEPATARKIPVSSYTSGKEKILKEIWNKYGGLIKPLADDLNVSFKVALAVMAAESSGNFLYSDNTPIIRFENHCFYQRWGGKSASNKTEFNKYFKPTTGWQNHKLLVSNTVFTSFSVADGTHLSETVWKTLHPSGSAEAEVRNKAALQQAIEISNDEMPYRNTSYGGVQVMGFNYKKLGYTSAKAVYDAMDVSEDGSEENHVFAFFDYVRSLHMVVRAMRDEDKLDYAGIASGYNGISRAKAMQAGEYGTKIKGYVSAANGMTFP